MMHIRNENWIGGSGAAILSSSTPLSRTHMNTMTNTADFSNQIAEADHSDFFPALFKKLFALFLLSGGVNSIDTALLAERIVQE
jgi:hypothetical protein